MPELLHKLRILADAAKYDASCASSGSSRKTPEGGIGNGASMGICHSYTPDGRCVSLLKLLLTNACIYDCLYCVNRVSSDVPRARFTPAEVAQLTLDFYRRNLIEGLFLSSGVLRDPDYTMEQVIEVARILREEHRFGGYIHLKVVPGAAPELLTRAGRLADRLSANVELPPLPPTCNAWRRRRSCPRSSRRCPESARAGTSCPASRLRGRARRW